MTNIYENVIQEFTKHNCQLLTTKEEHYEILKMSKMILFQVMKIFMEKIKEL